MIDRKRSIGLAAKELGVQEHVIRFWETQFPNVITPTIGAGGRRYYYDKDIDTLLQIKKYLYEDGYTIKGLQNLLSKNSTVNESKNSNFIEKIEEKEDNFNKQGDFDYYNNYTKQNKKEVNNSINSGINNRIIDKDLFNHNEKEEKNNFSIFNSIKERNNEVDNYNYYKNNSNYHTSNKKIDTNIKNMLTSFGERLMDFSIKLESI